MVPVTEGREWGHRGARGREGNLGRAVAAGSPSEGTGTKSEQGFRLRRRHGEPWVAGGADAVFNLLFTSYLGECQQRFKAKEIVGRILVDIQKLTESETFYSLKGGQGEAPRCQAPPPCPAGLRAPHAHLVPGPLPAAGSCCPRREGPRTPCTSAGPPSAQAAPGQATARGGHTLLTPGRGT